MSESKKSIGGALQGLFVVLLVGAAFAIGSMWTELKMLKNKTAEPTVQDEGSAEPDAVQLTEEGWNELISSGAGMKGSEEAKVIMVELTDYECPYCKRYVDEALVQIDKEYIATGKIKYILRDLPLSFHQFSQVTAEAARCAGDQGKYWEMHDKLFATQETWSQGTDNSLFKTYASQLGLKTEDFNSCLDSGKYSQIVKADLSLAEKVGASGTPTFFINGQKLVGAQPYTAFKALIDQELSK